MRLQQHNAVNGHNPVQWLFLDLNAFFASCEQQENPALRGKPVIVVQTPTDSAGTFTGTGRDEQDAP